MKKISYNLDDLMQEKMVGMLDFDILEFQIFEDQYEQRRLLNHRVKSEICQPHQIASLDTRESTLYVCVCARAIKKDIGGDSYSKISHPKIVVGLLLFIYISIMTHFSI